VTKVTNVTARPLPSPHFFSSPLPALRTPIPYLSPPHPSRSHPFPTAQRPPNAARGMPWAPLARCLAEPRPQKHFWYILSPEIVSGGNDLVCFASTNISVGAKSYNALTFCITCRPDKICSEQRPGLPIACTLTWLSTGQTITLLLDNDNSFFKQISLWKIPDVSKVSPWEFLYALSVVHYGPWCRCANLSSHDSTAVGLTSPSRSQFPLNRGPETGSATGRAP